MGVDFLNPAMLGGLAAIALPVLVHLISRRRFDIVEWGAMQFLQLGRRVRRRVRLEQLLLMLVRMLAIAALAVAFARPWLTGGRWWQLASRESRDVAIVIDSSYSMGRQHGSETPHSQAIQSIHKFLETLQPGDTVALIDARDQAHAVVRTPVSDFRMVRDKLNELPRPAGSSNLPEAILNATTRLIRGQHANRDVVVLTDHQAFPWRTTDQTAWVRIDDMLQQQSVRPRIWVLNMGSPAAEQQANFSVDRLKLSRDASVVGLPVRIETSVRYFGEGSNVSRLVYLEVDGQRLADQTTQVTLSPGSASAVEFEYAPQSAGSHVVTVSIDPDTLPADDRANAAIGVEAELPALIVDGDPQADPTRSESFFVSTALAPSSNAPAWVRARVIPQRELTKDSLESCRVLVLANVARISDPQIGLLEDFVGAGGGLMFALGDKVHADHYNAVLFKDGQGLLPARLNSVDTETASTVRGIRISDSTLTGDRLSGFRRERGGGLTDARFSRWWKLELPARAQSSPESAAETSNAPMNPTNQAGTASVWAALETRDPYLIEQRFGRGHVILLSAPLDSDWSALPTKPDFVPFLHELIFHLSSSATDRNVDVGAPLVAAVPQGFQFDQHVFDAPDGRELPVHAGGDSWQAFARLESTELPGTYSLRRRTENADNRPGPIEYFVAECDRRESDTTVLNKSDSLQIAGSGRLNFVNSVEELDDHLTSTATGTEASHILLLALIAFLAIEAIMTRRLVQGGHAIQDDAETDVEPTAEPTLAR